MHRQQASLAPVNALQTIGALGDDPIAAVLHRRGNHHAGAERRTLKRKPKLKRTTWMAQVARRAALARA